MKNTEVASLCSKLLGILALLLAIPSVQMIAGAAFQGNQSSLFLVISMLSLLLYVAAALILIGCSHRIGRHLLPEGGRSSDEQNQSLFMTFRIWPSLFLGWF